VAHAVNLPWPASSRFIQKPRRRKRDSKTAQAVQARFAMLDIDLVRLASD
jgi:hypothetical protein